MRWIKEYGLIIFILASLISSAFVLALDIGNIDNIFSEEISMRHGLSLTPQDRYDGFHIEVSEPENTLFDVKVERNQLIITPKFEDTLIKNECVIDVDEKETCTDIIYTQPDILDIKGVEEINELTKDIDGRFIIDIPERVMYLKIGNNSITLIGDTAYNSTDTNVTNGNRQAYLKTSTTAPYNSLVLYYAFDGDRTNVTAYDWSLSSINGTYRRISINSTDETNPYNDYVTSQSIGNFPSSIFIGTNITNFNIPNITISFWYYSPNNLTSGNEAKRLFEITNVTNNNLYTDLTVDTNRRLAMATRNSSGSTFNVISANNVYQLNNWTHIVYVRNVSAESVNQSIYVNGKANLSNVRAGGLQFEDGGGTESFILGNDGVLMSLNHSIDEFMIFNTTLNQSDISMIYNNQSNRFLNNGEMLFKTLNLTGNNTANVSIGTQQSLMGSNISVQFNSGAIINFTLNSSNSSNVFVYNITGDTISPNLTIRLYAGDNNFYTPLLMDNITIESWSVAGGDTTSPVVNLINPINNSLFTTTSVSLNATFTDETALVNATLWIWNSSGGILNNTINITITGTANGTNQTFNFPSNNTFYWNYEARDTSNNANMNRTNLTIRINTTIVAESNSCTYSSGDWNIQCHDNCSIISNVNVGGNFININGTNGNLNIRANVTNFLNLSFFRTNRAGACFVTNFNGGGFKNKG